MSTKTLTDLDRHTIALALNHSWVDLRDAVTGLRRGGKLDAAETHGLDGALAVALADAEALSDDDRRVVADPATLQNHPRVARFLKSKGRLTDLAGDLGARPKPSATDSVTALAPAVGRLLVTYERGVATVLLDGGSWYQTGQTHRLETGSYTVSLQLPASSFNPAADNVVIAASALSTTSFQ